MAKSDRGAPEAQKAAKAVYARPTQKVGRRGRAKVLTAAEKAAFLARRPDLAPKG